MQRLEGRTAFITGAASGIGLAVSTALIEAGTRVVLADVNKDLVARVAAQLGTNAAACVLDVTNRPQWSEAKVFTERRFGAVDILMCNAGIGPSGDELADMDAAVFDKIVAINLMGVFNGVATFAAGMRERRDGHIVATASSAGLLPLPRFGAYVATKFAAVGMMEALRMEMAAHNVGVSVLCPGLVRTPMMEAGMKSPPDQSGWPTDVRLGVIGPADVAAQLLDGIRSNRAHIMTHGEFREQVELRNQALLADFDGVPDRRP